MAPAFETVGDHTDKQLTPRPILHTVFRTPLLNRLLGWLASALLRVLGWRVVGELPVQQLKYVLIGAPHTSNWDFPLMLLAVLKVGLDLHWMGKDSLFPFPFRGLMKWLGGIPIDRSQANGQVAQTVARFQASERLVVLIPPEGTRAKVARWKTGFYHIAHGAGVPILLGFVDAQRRELGFGPLYFPSGDIERDLPEIKAFYQDKQGIRPELG